MKERKKRDRKSSIEEEKSQRQWAAVWHGQTYAAQS